LSFLGSARAPACTVRRPRRTDEGSTAASWFFRALVRVCGEAPQTARETRALPCIAAPV